MVLIEELEKAGCKVEFVERPMSTVTSSVTNNTASARSVTITYTLEDPTGRFQTRSETVRIGARKTFSRSFSYVVDESYPKGVYDLTVSATNSRGTSSATATLEIY
jgi:hypothetical protein